MKESRRDGCIRPEHTFSRSASCGKRRFTSDAPPSVRGIGELAEIVSRNEAVKQLKLLVLRLSRNNAPVLLIGESGTGKELFARAIHTASERSAKPFLAINCAAIPESLIENEFFGHVDGAFTGARKGGQPGVLERANSGTLFLDEISDMPVRGQLALLRAVENGEIVRVGDHRSVSVDVRFIAASSTPLAELVDKGEFRRELYHRLCVIPIHIPPLRERPEDIPLLLEHFLNQAGVPRQLPEDVLACLMRYPWPGNVREIRHCIDYMVAIGAGTLTADVLPPDILRWASFPSKPSGWNDNRPDGADSRTACAPGHPWASDLSRTDRAILETVAHANRQGRGVGRRPLVYRLRARGIDVGEGSIRSRLSFLKARNFVRWKAGRSGVWLTDAGRAVEAGPRHAASGMEE